MSFGKAVSVLLLLAAVAMAVFAVDGASDDADAAVVPFGGFHEQPVILPEQEEEQSAPEETETPVPNNMPVPFGMNVVPVIIPIFVPVPDMQDEEADEAPAAPEETPVIEVPEEIIASAYSSPVVMIQYDYSSLLNLSTLRTSLSQVAPSKKDVQDVSDSDDVVVVEEVDSDPDTQPVPKTMDEVQEVPSKDPLFSIIKPNSAGDAVGPIFC